MKARARSITALAGAMLLAFAGTAGAATQYNYTALNSLTGSGVVATAINNAGQITGSAYIDSKNSVAHAMVWNGASVTDLGAQGASSSGTAINSLGQIVGSQGSPTDDSVYLATQWGGAHPATLGTLGGNTQAYGINTAGTVVGYAVDGNRVQQATIWNNGNATALNSLSSVNPGSAAANAINTAGTVAGFSSLDNGEQHAVTWSKGVITDLGTPGTSSSANAINDAGVVAGLLTAIDGSNHAVLWKNGTVTDLGVGAAGLGAEALGINNIGQTVGTAFGNDLSHAVLWNGTTEIDLNNYLSAGLVSDGWVLQDAFGINDKGQIVGDAFNTHTSATEAFLLSPAPVPEADTYAMLLAGLAMVGWMARRRKTA